MNKQNFFVITIICFIMMILFAKLCWNKVLGFNVCESVLNVSASSVIIDESTNKISISGKTKSEFAAFSGPVYEVRGSKLYVGIRKNFINGIFSSRNYFEINIPCKASSIDEIVIFDGKRERCVWRRKGLMHQNIKSRIIKSISNDNKFP